MIKHKMKLLQQLADQLECEDVKYDPISLFVVRLLVDGDATVYEFTIAQFLDFIVNDVYSDDRGNWAEASQLDVYTL